MVKYDITFSFDGNDSLNDIFIKVLLREISNLKKNNVPIFCTYPSLNEGGNGEYE